MSRRRAARIPGPQHGPAPRRAPAAMQVLSTGAWDGARSDLRELRSWNPGEGSAVTDNLGDLPYLRNRVRDLVRNAPLAAGARQTVRMGVVGAGLQLYPRVVRGLLERRAGLTPAALDAFERDASELWWAWSDSTSCDIRASRRFRALTAQVFAAAWTDGDCLVVRRHALRPLDPLSLKLQLIEADRLSTPPELRHDPRVIDGVEHDADGMPVAYYVEEVHPGERFVRPGARRWRRVEATVAGIPRVLHVRNLSADDRIGSIRALPSLAPVIVLLKQLARYSHAELTRNVVASSVTAFIETQDGANATSTGLAPINPDDLPAHAWEYKLEAGAVVELEPGKKMTLAAPPGPAATFDPFTNHLLSQMGAAINVPRELIIRHFSASYSASRAAVNFAYEAFAIMRGWLEDDFVAPVYEWFVHEAVAMGLLAAPGFFADPLVRKAFLNFRLTGPVAPQLDPLKEAVAADQRMRSLLSTREEETAQTTGGDWGDNLAQLAKERQQIRDAGLDVEATAERIRTEPIQPVPAESDDAGGEADDSGTIGRPGRQDTSARRRALLTALLRDEPGALAGIG